MHDIADGYGNRRLIAEFDKTVAFKDHVAFDDVVQTVPACRHARRYACPRNRQSWIVVMVRPFADEAALLGQRVDSSAHGCGLSVVNTTSTVEVSEGRSEEHTSELQSLMRNSYAVFCLKKKKKQN